MDLRIIMPDLATTGSAIRVLRWLVKPGDSVKRGQVILEVETDKATMEVESTVSGTLIELALQEGDEASTGELMATIRSEEPTGASAGPRASSVPVPADRVDSPKGDLAPTPIPRALPRRGLFERNAIQQAGAGPALSPAGRATAQRLAQSKQTIPHFYVTMSADAEAMAARRELLGKPVWDAFFVKAVSVSLARFDRLACRFEDNTLVRQESDAVGVAADIDGDLYVLRVDHPREKSIEQISADIRRELEKIRLDEPGARRPRPGAICISNLGNSGVESFSAIINPPEAAILAIGAIAPRACVVDGQVKVRRNVSLTLSVDHRVANGKYAAEFLASIVKEIENP